MLILQILCKELIAIFQYLKRAWRETGQGLLIKNSSDRTRSNMFKTKKGKFRLNIRKKFYTLRVMRH